MLFQFQVYSEVIQLYMHLFFFMEKAMAPHSSTLAWRIPWTEESGRLQSMGLQRVGNDWAHKQTSNNCVRGTVNRKGGEGNGEPGRLQSMGSLRVGHY